MMTSWHRNLSRITDPLGEEFPVIEVCILVSFSCVSRKYIQDLNLAITVLVFIPAPNGAKPSASTVRTAKLYIYFSLVVSNMQILSNDVMPFNMADRNTAKLTALHLFIGFLQVQLSFDSRIVQHMHLVQCRCTISVRVGTEWYLHLFPWWIHAPSDCIIPFSA